MFKISMVYLFDDIFALALIQMEKDVDRSSKFLNRSQDVEDVEFVVDCLLSLNEVSLGFVGPLEVNNNDGALQSTMYVTTFALVACWVMIM